jgi:hypothetical protein
MAKQLVCGTCGFFGTPKQAFSISKQKFVCAKCGGDILLPPDSPVGKKMLAESGMPEAKVTEVATQATTQAKKKERRKTNFKTFVVIGFILIFGIPLVSIMNSVTSTSTSTPTPKTSSVDMTVIEKSVAGLQKTGLIKNIDVNLNKAYVNGFNWSSLNIQDKENVGKALAYYVAYHKGNDLHWVEIYDWNSGKKLAKYSESWGFETY